MTFWGDAITHARTAARLELGDLSNLADLTAARLDALERGAEPTTQELDAIATVFGIELSELAGAEIDGAPATLLFRAWPEVQGDLSLFGAQNARTLGTFLRCVRRLDTLEPSRSSLGALGVSPELAAAATATERGAELAARVRQSLGLAEAEAIPSMLQLCGQLGVAVFGLLEEDDPLPGIDAACTLLPQPAVLLNLSGYRGSWWRVRMTLAHELAHLLFDHVGPHGLTLPYLVSPQRRSSALLEGIERRANAFAASFLAPPAGVRTCVQPLDDPTCEEAISRIIHTFGVGRSVAVNRITDVVLEAKDSRRESMERRASHRPMPDWGSDTYPTHHCGLPGGPLRASVLRRFEEGTMGALRARELLDLEPTDWLPEGAGLSHERRQPLLSRRDVVSRLATQLLRRAGYGLRTVPTDVERVGDLRRVTVAEWTDDGHQRVCGELILDDGLDLIETVLPLTRR